MCHATLCEGERCIVRDMLRLRTITLGWAESVWDVRVGYGSQ